MQFGDAVAQLAQLLDLADDGRYGFFGLLQFGFVQLVLGGLAQGGEDQDLLSLVLQQLLDFGGQLRGADRIAVGDHTFVSRVTAPEVRAHVDREQDQDGDQREGESAA